MASRFADLVVGMPVRCVNRGGEYMDAGRVEAKGHDWAVIRTARTCYLARIEDEFEPPEDES